MKRCPECRRDYYDDSLLYCLDDGSALLEGPASELEPTASVGGRFVDEPQTAILSEPPGSAGGTPLGENATRLQLHTTAEAEPQTRFTLSDDLKERSFRANRAARALAVSVALAVILGGAYFAYRYFSAASATEKIESIAVLPFQNASGDVNIDYLSDGLAESIINSLTQLQQLKVTARNTAFRYKAQEIDAKQLGVELGVRAVLMGRVRQVDDKLNVQVDLVDTVDGTQLWGKEFEGPLNSTVAIKQSIAREVSNKLRLGLTGEQEQQLSKRDTPNSEAYQYYLRGRYYWNKRTKQGLERAIDEFQRAVELDPRYALGHVGLGDSYLLLSDYASVPTSETLPKAKASIDTALSIDPSLAEAHTSLADIHQRQWNWAAAEEEFKLSIELNPRYPTAHHWYTLLLLNTGRSDQALTEAQRAIELDPMAPIIITNLANMYISRGELETAERELRKLLETEPNFQNALALLGHIRVKQNRLDEALDYFKKALDVSGGESGYLCNVGYTYGLMGKKNDALAIVRELQARYADNRATGTEVAVAFVGLGDRDQTFAWLEKDFNSRSGVLPDMAHWFNFDGIRSDPRYLDLLRRLNLKP